MANDDPRGTLKHRRRQQRIVLRSGTFLFVYLLSCLVSVSYAWTRPDGHIEWLRVGNGSVIRGFTSRQYLRQMPFEIRLEPGINLMPIPWPGRYTMGGFLVPRWDILSFSLLPFALVYSMLGLLAASYLWFVRPTGCCANRGYNLAGLAAPRCPECGHGVTP